MLPGWKNRIVFPDFRGFYVLDMSAVFFSRLRPLYSNVCSNKYLKYWLPSYLCFFVFKLIVEMEQASGF